MSFVFGIERWDVWSAGIRGEDAWRKNLPGSNDSIHSSSLSDAECLYLKPRQKRRLSHISKITLDVAFGAVSEYQSLPTVFASRRGEVGRMAELLKSICSGEDASPMGFSLSVHNTASGLFSINSGNQSASTAIAAGHDTVVSALLEANAQLASGKEKVLLVIAEETMPEVYASFAGDNEQPVAAAFVLNRTPEFTLEINAMRSTNARPYSTDQQIRLLLTSMLQNQSVSIEGERLEGRLLRL